MNKPAFLLLIWGFVLVVGSTAADGQVIEWMLPTGSQTITVDTDGSIYKASGGNDVHFARCDSVGAVQWVEEFGTAYNDGVRGIAADGLGGVYLSGYTYGSLGGTNKGMSDGYLAKYATDGTQNWIRQFGTTDSDDCVGVAVDSLGSVYVCGNAKDSLFGPHLGYTDVFLAKYSSSGVKLWATQFGTANCEYARNMVIDEQDCTF